MAVAYPEGKAFFKRSGLDAKRLGWYQAENEKDFFGHMMVEYIWNKEAYHQPSTSYSNPRSTYKVVRGDWWNTNYGCWQDIAFSYGPNHKVIKTRLQHDLCTNGNIFKDFERGAGLRSYYMTMPMPKKDEGGWVFIDRLTWIRSIHIPIMHSSSPDYPELCTFVHVNFALDKKVDIFHDFGNETLPVPFTMDKSTGIHVDHEWAIAINVPGLVKLLAIPLELRKGNAYSTKNIMMVRSSELQTKHDIDRRYSDSADLAFETVLSSNVGIDLQPILSAPDFWWKGFIKNSTTFALGFIPIVGPIAAASFQLIWTAVDKPENLIQEIRNQMPTVDLTMGIIDELKRDLKEMNGNMAKGINIVPDTSATRTAGNRQLMMLDNIGPNVAFLQAKEVLRY